MKTNHKAAEKPATVAAKAIETLDLVLFQGVAELEFAAWLDIELAELEARHGEFVTPESLQRHNGKSRR